MIKLIVSAVSFSFLIVASISIPWAIDNEPRQEFLFESSNPDIKLVVDIGNNEFFIRDQDCEYDLFERMIYRLYGKSDSLYKNYLNSIEVFSIVKKYSDLHTYVVDYEFSIKRCLQDITRECELDRGLASLNVLLGSRGLTYPLTIFSMPEVEIKAMW